jgi:hypothetical protein
MADQFWTSPHSRRSCIPYTRPELNSESDDRTNHSPGRFHCVGMGKPANCWTRCNILPVDVIALSSVYRFELAPLTVRPKAAAWWILRQSSHDIDRRMERSRGRRISRGRLCGASNPSVSNTVVMMASEDEQEV